MATVQSYSMLVVRFLFLLLGLLPTISSNSFTAAAILNYGTDLLNRSSFPEGFLFGTSSSAYQYEGTVGRGLSIWDTYTHKYPDKIKDRSNADVAVDQYHRYKEDVGIIKDIGLDAHRISISWPRILPKGKLSGGVNEEGIKYYNNLINELLANGIEPFVTLFHWELPQTLYDEYGGFISSKIIDDFQDFADICFKHFGDRVKHWITINEPLSICMGGYTIGMYAPFRCSEWLQRNCTGGDSAIEPYIVAHNVLLAHASTIKLYKTKYQETQKGKIGITLVTNWFVPHSNSNQDEEAAKRAQDFFFGWFMDPITHGDYPQTLKFLVGIRLPKFTEEQSELLKGSFDFLGLNYYSANYVAHMDYPDSVYPSYLTDHRAKLSGDRDGILIGPQAASYWLYVYPRGLLDLLLYIKNKYNNPMIYITENGVDEINNDTLTLEEELADHIRIDYHYHHLSFLKKAISEGANVKGYFAYTLLDNFEWDSGFSVRFGLNYVDFKDGLKRYPKLSAKWFKEFLKRDSKTTDFKDEL